MQSEQPEHSPVLFHEVLEALNIRPDGICLDGTFGRGGHSRGILGQLDDRGRLYALDRDPTAADAALLLDHDQRFRFVATPFSALKSVAEARELDGRVDGILLDLGVSSPQLDRAERGFSFQQDGPLDMRMDTTSGQTAAEWLSKASDDEIIRVLKEFGEERFARRIATAILAYRLEAPLQTTRQLAALIEEAVPVRERNKHPATRSFQAIRIFINGELDELRQALQAALDILSPGGRLAVISFHSLEDRMVKRFMRDQALGDKIPRGVPIMGDRLNAHMRLIGKKITAKRDEVERNPRSRSAVLRVAEKLA